MPGLPELIILLLLAALLFGVGRISKLGGEFGEAIGNFRRGVQSASEVDEDVMLTENE